LTIRTLTLAVVLLTSVAAVAEQSYKVHRGDTLAKISQRCGVSVDAIKQANDLQSEHVHRGQVLQIPDKQPATIGKAEVIADTVPHAGPFDGSKSLDPVLSGTSAKALEQKPGWIKLSGIGWLSTDLVKFTPAHAQQLALVPAPAPTPAAKPKPKSTHDVVVAIAQSDNSLLKKALTYRGVRYRWGGTSRSSGVDCSGFTSSVFKSQGIDLPRTSIEQSHVGKAVSKSDLKPGDLIFFRTSRSYRINHVGIYVGDNKFIHAATGAGHVMVSSLDEAYFQRCYAAARRVADFRVGSRAAEESTKVAAAQ